MILKHKILILGSSLVGMGVGSLGLGVAHAQTVAPPAAVTTAGHTSTLPGSAEGPKAAAGVESDGPGGHQDANGADVQSGGGHQDANGSDVATGGGA